MQHKTISVILPAFREQASIGKVVAELHAAFDGLEVLVIDDGSNDHTSQQALQAGATLISHPYNIGNGAAVKSGIRAATGTALIFMDSDGQHDPSDISTLLGYLDRYDMVVGARSNDQQASWIRQWMNRFFNRLAAYVTNFKVEDLTSGFRAMRLDTARNLLPLLPNGYSWPTTSTLVLLRSGLSVKYVPINAQPRRHGRSRIRPIRDGARFLLIIAKICTLYSPFRIFLPVSGVMFMLGAINYAYTYFTVGRFTNMSALMFSVAVIIFMMGLISEQISQISLLRQQMPPGEAKANHDPTDGSDNAD
jgi:glycosyltransferase involved in cell wall biosynthesis